MKKIIVAVSLLSLFILPGCRSRFRYGAQYDLLHGYVVNHTISSQSIQEREAGQLKTQLGVLAWLLGLSFALSLSLSLGGAFSYDIVSDGRGQNHIGVQ